MTTPIARSRPNEAGPWQGLGTTLGREGDLDLADRAFAAAFAAEPTDAQILWDRAQNLRQAGKLARSRPSLAADRRRHLAAALQRLQIAGPLATGGPLRRAEGRKPPVGDAASNADAPVFRTGASVF